VLRLLYFLIDVIVPLNKRKPEIAYANGNVEVANDESVDEAIGDRGNP
jgi:hypothetical protein